jgi:hypothetical protein
MTRGATRSFTVQERRTFRLERWSLCVQLAVAVIGAVISFQALRDAGLRMGLSWASPLLPLAIDGFAVIASLGIIRSQGAGERLHERASEWLGLCFVLALSIAGNVAHALDRMEPDFPRILAGLFGAAPPIIVAYGIHVYGRAMTSGVSRHVLVDDPDRIHFGLAHLGDGNDTTQSPGGRRDAVQPRVRASARKAAQPPVHSSDESRVSNAGPASLHATAQKPAQVNGGRYPRDPARQRAFEVWGQLFAGRPVNAKEVLRRAQVSKDESTVRRWCRGWEREADVEADVPETGHASVPRSA